MDMDVVVEVRLRLRVLDRVRVLARRSADDGVGDNVLVDVRRERRGNTDLVAPQVGAVSHLLVVNASMGLQRA